MIARIRKELNNPSDFFYDILNNGYYEMEICFFPSLCDQNLIQDILLSPYSYNFDRDQFFRMIHSNPNFAEADQPEIWTELLLKGSVLFQLEDRVYRFDVQRKLQDKPDTTQIESALQGPQTALTEDLDLNISLIRMRYNEPTLCVEQHIIGVTSKTRVTVLYDKNEVNQHVLLQLQQQISQLNIKMLRAAGQLVKQLSGKYKLFPVMIQTERPDRIAAMIQRGKIAILQDGNRLGLILPARLFDFLHAMDDDYESFWMSKLLLILRYLAMILTLMLPSLYISIVSYNPELLRVQLTLSIAGSRVVVPYPSFIEVIIMLFMIEALNEASIRLPRSIGSTATTVGGLILGQSIQQAGLVSSIMIIVTSVVAISNYVIPNNSFSYSIRFVKYLFVTISIFYGLLGVVVLFFALIVYWCNLRSFGEPYLNLYNPKSKSRHGGGK